MGRNLWMKYCRGGRPEVLAVKAEPDETALEAIYRTKREKGMPITAFVDVIWIGPRPER